MIAFHLNIGVAAMVQAVTKSQKALLNLFYGKFQLDMSMLRIVQMYGNHYYRDSLMLLCG